MSPPSRTAGVGYIYVSDDVFGPVYKLKWDLHGPRTARTLHTNVTGLASSACPQYIASMYIHVMVLH